MTSRKTGGCAERILSSEATLTYSSLSAVSVTLWGSDILIEMATQMANANDFVYNDFVKWDRE